MAIAKVVRIVHTKEQPSDRAYWLSRPVEERLAAVEELRREYHRWKDHAEPRLQKICAIVKMKST